MISLYFLSAIILFTARLLILINYRLKCSRGNPCDECIKRGKGELCQYASNAIRNKPVARDLQDRLRKVEDMVSELVRSREHQVLSAPRRDRAVASEIRQEAPPKAPVNVMRSPEVQNPSPRQPRDERKVPLQSSPWLSIVDEIKEIREQLGVTPSSIAEEVPDHKEVDLVLGPVHLPTIADIVASLPPRQTCDTLVSYYFGSKYMVFRMLFLLGF